MTAVSGERTAFANVQSLRPGHCAVVESGRLRSRAYWTLPLPSIEDDLGFSTIGEGIETESQHERLLELGCPLGQGYLFAKPMPLQTLIRSIENGKMTSTPVALAS